jgi:hypothetical protein
MSRYEFNRYRATFAMTTDCHLADRHSASISTNVPTRTRGYHLVRHPVDYLVLVGFVRPLRLFFWVLGIEPVSLTARFRIHRPMTRDEFAKHVGDLESPFEIQPPPQGILNNKFTLGNWDANHIIIKTQHSQAELFLPYNLIDAINPGTLKLTKIVRITGKLLA